MANNSFKGSIYFHGPSRALITESTTDSNLTIDKHTQLVFADTSTSALTITLPSGSVVEGKEVIIVDAGGNANTKNITVTSHDSNVHMDGSDQDLTISADNGQLFLVCDGSHWYSII